jgi:hypothetical protein
MQGLINGASTPNSRRLVMLRKLVLGLAAVAALSATAMMPTAASAKGWKHHHHHHGFHGHSWGGPKFIVGGGYGGCYVKRLVETPYGLRYRVVNVCF